jgi:hypothetical protein
LISFPVQDEKSLRLLQEHQILKDHDTFNDQSSNGIHLPLPLTKSRTLQDINPLKSNLPPFAGTPSHSLQLTPSSPTQPSIMSTTRPEQKYNSVLSFINECLQWGKLDIRGRVVHLFDESEKAGSIL